MDNEKMEELIPEMLDCVSGGANDGGGYLNSLEEIENSPIFNKLKTWLGRRKKAGYELKTGITQALCDYASKLGYVLGNGKPAAEFCKKYWDQV